MITPWPGLVRRCRSRPGRGGGATQRRLFGAAAAGTYGRRSRPPVCAAGARVLAPRDTFSHGSRLSGKRCGDTPPAGQDPLTATCVGWRQLPTARRFARSRIGLACRPRVAGSWVGWCQPRRRSRQCPSSRRRVCGPACRLRPCRKAPDGHERRASGPGNRARFTVRPALEAPEVDAAIRRAAGRAPLEEGAPAVETVAMLRERIAVAAGLPAGLGARLEGSTESALRADARRLVGALPASLSVPPASAARARRRPRLGPA